jgi:hypothetical protein
MLKLAELVPNNYQEEKAKFFAANFQYNPQFHYQRRIQKSELLTYGKPKFGYLLLARWILWRGRKQDFLNLTQENISKESLEKTIQQYLAEYHLEKIYQIKFSEHFTTRFSVNQTEKTIKVRLPIIINPQRLQATLDHEIGTHVLRQINYEQQPWFKKKKRFGIHHSYLRTEEGLANIHSYLYQVDTSPYLKKAALNYLQVEYALQHDFAKTFAFVNQYFKNPEKSFSWTFRKKRGVEDTRLALAFTKDMLYFEGIIEVLRYFKRHHFDPSLLYFGKFAVADADKVWQLNPQYQAILPKFFLDNPQEYQRKLQKLVRYNLPCFC